MVSPHATLTSAAIAANTFSGVAAAAAGLAGVFAVAIGFHLRARDDSPQLGLAAGFLALNATVPAREIAGGRDA